MFGPPRTRFAGLALTLACILVSSGSAHADSGSTLHPVRHQRSAKHRRRAGVAPRLTRIAHASAATPDPSGVPIPTGNIPGWREVFHDDFTEANMASNWQWSAYWGQPGGDPGGFWDPNHAVISNGELSLKGYKDDSNVIYGEPPGAYETAGVSSSPSFAQTYGKYLVRFRMDQGQGNAGVLLLWPANGSWPPEIDFSEDNGATPRSTTYATLHYGANNSTIGKSTAVNLTQWHTLGVEWTKGRLVYTLDGKNWATVSNKNVPNIPMVLTMQTQAWACGTSTWEQCPNANTPAEVDMQIDWVVAYAQS
jgi:beta-glucanase (GH16 family)